MQGAARCIISIKSDLPDRFHVIQKYVLSCTTTYITSDCLYYSFLSSNCTCNSKDNEQYSSRACIASYATELGFPVEIFWLFDNATPQVTIYVIIFASQLTFTWLFIQNLRWKHQTNDANNVCISGVSIINSEQISHIFLVFPQLALSK